MLISKKFCTNISKRYAYLGSGFVSTVYKGPHNVVYKVASFLDGTYVYLRWCKHMQDIGLGMRGMPEIHSLNRVKGGGYMATMKEYEPLDDDDTNHNIDTLRYPEHINALIMEFHEYAYNGEFFRKKHIKKEFSHSQWDLHSENFMLDKGGVMVLIDPTAATPLHPNGVKNTKFALTYG